MYHTIVPFINSKVHNNSATNSRTAITIVHHRAFYVHEEKAVPVLLAQLCAEISARRLPQCLTSRRSYVVSEPFCNSYLFNQVLRLGGNQTVSSATNSKFTKTRIDTE